MTTTTAGPPLGYLVSCYPAVSHTFILREVQRLRALGHTIHTASINRPDRRREAMEAAEREAADSTLCLKAQGWRGALAAAAASMLQSPAGCWRVLRQATSLGKGWRGLAYAAEALMVAQWMRRLGLAHLHVHFGNVGATVGLLVKTFNGCHLSYTIHGPDEFDDVPGQVLARKMAAADRVVCISQFARGQLMRISHPDHWAKMSVCRLGVDPGQFTYQARQPHSEPTRLLCVGRLTPAKGQMVLLQAVHALVQQGVALQLCMVGDGPDRPKLEAATRQWGLQDHVQFLGSVGQAQVRDEMARGDLFVLPSFAEGIPVVLMEAMASGLPCVSSPVNGIPELIEHRSTGWLTPAGDAAALAQALQALIAQPQLRHDLALRARDRVRDHFDLDANTGQLSLIFKQFVSATQPSPHTGAARWIFRF